MLSGEIAIIIIIIIIVANALVCRSLSQYFKSHSDHYFLNFRLVIYKYCLNLFFSIIDVKLMIVEIDSTSSWR